MCIHISIYIYIYIYMYTTHLLRYTCMYYHISTHTHLISEKGEVLLRWVGTVQYVLVLSENSACQVPICALAAWWFKDPLNKVVPRSRIPRSTSHVSYDAHMYTHKQVRARTATHGYHVRAPFACLHRRAHAHDTYNRNGATMTLRRCVV